MYQVGDVALLQKPDLLRDGLNAKCGDYRNAQLRLANLALIVTLEIGGIKAERVEAALEVIRRDPHAGPSTSGPLLAALAGR